jgi:hypothetical protein
MLSMTSTQALITHWLIASGCVQVCIHGLSASCLPFHGGEYTSKPHSVPPMDCPRSRRPLSPFNRDLRVLFPKRLPPPSEFLMEDGPLLSACTLDPCADTVQSGDMTSFQTNKRVTITSTHKAKCKHESGRLQAGRFRSPRDRKAYGGR